MECTFTETPKSASLFSSDLIVCVCGRERSESGVSLVSNRSLESQDGLFTSILKLYETKIAFFFFGLTQDIMHSSIFSLNSAILYSWKSGIGTSFSSWKSMVLLSVMLRKIINLCCNLVTYSESFKKWFHFSKGCAFFFLDRLWLKPEGITF